MGVTQHELARNGMPIRQKSWRAKAKQAWEKYAVDSATPQAKTSPAYIRQANQAYTSPSAITFRLYHVFHPYGLLEIANYVPMILKFQF